MAPSSVEPNATDTASAKMEEDAIGSQKTLPPAKRVKVDSLDEEHEDVNVSVRTFSIKTLGGEEFEVSVPGHSDVGDLEAEVAKTMGLGLCFTLIGTDGQLLNDISVPLPKEGQLSCQVESPSQLCAAAQKVLQKKVPKGKESTEERREDLHLGRCRALGRFPCEMWTEGGIDPDILDDDGDTHFDLFGAYCVYEFTLMDADDKRLRLIGVINDGDEGSNSGMWGSVYLRPGLQEVGTIRSNEECSSIWAFQDESWYKAPQTLPQCDDKMFGGSENAKTPLQNHLAHALKQASDNAEEDVDSEEGEEGDEEGDED